MDALDPGALSALAFIVSALLVGAASLAWWVWRRGWHVGRPPRE